MRMVVFRFLRLVYPCIKFIKGCRINGRNSESAAFYNAGNIVAQYFRNINKSHFSPVFIPETLPVPANNLKFIQEKE